MEKELAQFSAIVQTAAARIPITSVIAFGRRRNALNFSSTVVSNGGNLDCIAADPSFNPHNVASLLGNLPTEGFAMSLVEVASSEGDGTPAERVAALLGKRVEEVRAQLDGADLA